MDRNRRTYKTRGFTYCDDVVRTQRARLRNEERRMLRRGSFVRNRSLEVPEEETKVPINAGSVRKRVLHDKQLTGRGMPTYVPQNLRNNVRTGQKCNRARAMSLTRQRRVLQLVNDKLNGEIQVIKKELFKQKYEKWKKGKELSKQLSKSANRPPFKCGSVKHNDAELYKNVDTCSKVTRSNTKEQKPLAPAGFVFKAPKGIVPLPCKPLTTPRPMRNCKIFPSPKILRKNPDKENHADQHGAESSFMCRDFATMSLLQVQHPKGLKNETTKPQAGGDELPERRRTRALTRFEDEEKRDVARH